MKVIIMDSTFFGVVISLLAYAVGVVCKNKFKIAIFNPLLIGILLVMLAISAIGVDYETYNEGAQYITYLLTPATVSLAIPLYEKLKLLKENFKAIMLGILSGVLTSLVSVLAMSYILGLSHKEYVSLLPKSITTAIGMGVSEELGGYVAITVAVIVITGIFGNMMAVTICRIFRIEDPIARGVGIGSASHAMGTAKAIEMGETEGAMSGLSIAIAGILTVVGAGIFAGFY